MKRAVVTGCAGFIGSHLTDQLLANGWSVIGIDNLTTGRRENICQHDDEDHFRFIEDTVVNASLHEVIDTEVDVVYHLAAIASVKWSIDDPVLTDQVNAGGTVNTLQLARHLKAKRFVFISSAAVYGDSPKTPVTEEQKVSALTPYAASKIAGEQYVKAFDNCYDLETTILRYFNVFGPRQAYSPYSGVVSIFINQALSGEPITVNGDGRQTRSMIYVEDVARITARAGQLQQAHGETMNVAGRDEISILELARRINELIPDSPSEIVHTEARKGDIRRSMASTERVSRLLDFSPEVSLTEGLKQTIDWYRLNPQQSATSLSR